MKKILSIILSLIILTSCTTQSNSIVPYTSMEESMRLLTSADFDGRRPGTEGNLKTQEYLEKSLENFNIQPYDDSYYWEFPYIFYDVKEAYIEIEGEKFNYNKDLQIRYVTDSTVDIVSALKSEPLPGEKYVLLTEDATNSNNNDESVQAVILNVNEFDNLEFIYEPNIKDKPLIVVEEETYKKLQQKIDSDITIHIDIDKQEKKENNIVGIIKADNNPENQAVVISAHFDHIGSYKDSLYAGALDNASGVSAILEATKYLVENLKTEVINRDIIIAFFNLEEELLRLGGSSKFAKELESKYDTVLDINIDCLGLDYGKTVIGYNNLTPVNETTVKELEGILTVASIDTDTGEYSTSDHINFNNGICLYSENQHDVIHRTKDTVDNLDLEKMREISKLLGKYIIDLSKRESISANDTGESMVTYVSDMVNETMDIGTCKVIEKDGIKHHISEYGYTGKLENAEKIFNYPFIEKFKGISEIDEDIFLHLLIPNFISILEKQDDGKYVVKDVKCNTAELYLDEHEPDKLYEKEISLDDVGVISIGDISVDRFNNGIIHIYSDQYEQDKQKIIDNAEIVLNYEGYDIYYYYNQMQDEKYLSAIKETGKNKYICNMRCKGPDISSEADIKNIIEKNNTIVLWEAMIEIFEGK
ncbi:M28 family peptidase [Sedimentibacter sp.]|uniref:M28 family metallopeptidase n=1 Tax=Sedimentibacter sp. TaxID=1960295 RepID=UPI0028A0E0B9|nr:M28 family peptidase [Sedimentibacter sp.]